MYMYDIYIQGTQKIHQLTSPHLAQSVSSAQGPDVVGAVSYHAGTPTSWQRSSPHPHHPPHPRRHRYHHPCEHAPPKDHPNEAPSTASVPPVPPTAPAVSAAPVPPTAPAVSAAPVPPTAPPTASAAPVSPTAPAVATAPVPPAPPIAPVAPAPVRLSCEWVTQLGVVVSRSYQPP